jgi:hypothetical protein
LNATKIINAFGAEVASAIRIGGTPPTHRHAQPAISLDAMLNPTTTLLSLRRLRRITFRTGNAPSSIAFGRKHRVFAFGDGQRLIPH